VMLRILGQRDKITEIPRKVEASWKSDERRRRGRSSASRGPRRRRVQGVVGSRQVQGTTYRVGGGSREAAAGLATGVCGDAPAIPEGDALQWRKDRDSQRSAAWRAKEKAGSQTVAGTRIDIEAARRADGSSGQDAADKAQHPSSHDGQRPAGDDFKRNPRRVHRDRPPKPLHRPQAGRLWRIRYQRTGGEFFAGMSRPRS